MSIVDAGPAPEPPAEPAPRRPVLRLAVTIVSVLAGLLLVALAIPRLGAALDLASAKPTYDRLQRGDTTVDDAALQAAIASMTSAFRRSGEPNYGVMLAYLQLAAADRASADRARAERHLDEAIATTRETVRVSPANVLAWLMLAMALESKDPRDPAAVAALTRAVHVGPYDARMSAYRVALAMRQWNRLDASTRRLVSAQILRYVTNDPRYLAAMARESFGLPAVHEALLGQPELKARFDAAYLAKPR